MKILAKTLATVATLGMMAPITFAQGVGVNAGVGVSANAQVGRASTTMTGNTNVGNKSEQGSTTAAKRGDNATTTGVLMREENRSAVAAEVQALLKIADRDGGIGAEVRLIAQEHASSSVHIEEATEAVKNRPGWLTFIFGTDYGNLGRLRSEIQTTENQIQRLTNAIDRTADLSVKTELEAQIEVLSERASTTAAFIAENESQFSLLGWFFRIFQ